MLFATTHTVKVKWLSSDLHAQVLINSLYLQVFLSAYVLVLNIIFTTSFGAYPWNCGQAGDQAKLLLVFLIQYLSARKCLFLMVYFDAEWSS